MFFLLLCLGILAIGVGLEIRSKFQITGLPQVDHPESERLRTVRNMGVYGRGGSSHDRRKAWRKTLRALSGLGNR